MFLGEKHATVTPPSKQNSCLEKGLFVKGIKGRWWVTLTPGSSGFTQCVSVHPAEHEQPLSNPQPEGNSSDSTVRTKGCLYRGHSLSLFLRNDSQEGSSD